jgi:hypothetical protein
MVRGAIMIRWVDESSGTELLKLAEQGEDEELASQAEDFGVTGRSTVVGFSVEG